MYLIAFFSMLFIYFVVHKSFSLSFSKEKYSEESYDSDDQNGDFYSNKARDMSPRKSRDSYTAVYEFYDNEILILKENKKRVDYNKSSNIEYSHE